MYVSAQEFSILNGARALGATGHLNEPATEEGLSREMRALRLEDAEQKVAERLHRDIDAITGEMAEHDAMERWERERRAREQEDDNYSESSSLLTMENESVASSVPVMEEKEESNEEVIVFHVEAAMNKMLDDPESKEVEF